MKNRTGVVSSQENGLGGLGVDADLEGRASPTLSSLASLSHSPPPSPFRHDVSVVSAATSAGSSFETGRISKHVLAKSASELLARRALLLAVAVGLSLSCLLMISYSSVASPQSLETTIPTTRLISLVNEDEAEYWRQPRLWNRDDSPSYREERQKQIAEIMEKRKQDGKQLTQEEELRDKGERDQIKAMVGAAEAAARAAEAAANAAQAAVRATELRGTELRTNVKSVNPESDPQASKSNTQTKHTSKAVATPPPPPPPPSPEAYATALEQSFGFFNDITSEAWERMHNHFLNMRVHGNHEKPSMPMEHSNNARAWYQVNWEPNFSCAHERRIGGMGDGPKWVCDPHRIPASVAARPPEQKKDEKCLIYSVGSEGNAMFERGIIDTLGEDACEIHTFDLKDYSPSMPPNIHFHPWGLQPSGGFVNPGISIAGGVRTQGNFKSLQEIVSELGHEGRVIDIFKIDCEGCEWTTFKDWFSANVDIRQILVEVHQVPGVANEFFEGMQQNGYVTFHKEPNTMYAGGDCQEYAFLKLDKPFFEASV